jgi:hypothetical protein
MEAATTISAITRLQHFLVDVWEWQQLHRIGLDLFTVQLIPSPGDTDHRDLSRSADVRLSTHLSACYATASAEIDKSVAALPHSDLLDAMLEQLHAQLVRLSNIEVSYKEWYDRTAHPDITDFERAPDGSERSEAQTRQAERDHHTLQRNAWRCVADELSFFLTKLAAKVERTRSAMHTASSTTPAHGARLQWTASTAAYVHLVKQLLAKGYLDIPTQNGKNGDGNITEVFRRLSHSIHLKGRNDSEIMPDELQRRFNGRPMAASKSARFDLPEAEEM